MCVGVFLLMYPEDGNSTNIPEQQPREHRSASVKGVLAVDEVGRSVLAKLQAWEVSGNPLPLIINLPIP